MYSVIAAVRGARVLAFEPNGKARATLAANLVLNRVEDRVRILSCALADFTGSARFTTDLEECNHLQIESGATGEVVEVRQLDALIEPGARVALIKIDVEGFDEAVLRGARGSPERERPVLIIETWAGAHSIRRFLAVLGYEFFLYERGLRPLPPAFEGDANLVAIHTGRVDWVQERLRTASMNKSRRPRARSILDASGGLPDTQERNPMTRPLAFGSDFPVELTDARLGLFATVTRTDLEGHPPRGWRPDQRLTVDEALRAFTTGAAYAAFEEGWRGELKAGQLANLTVFDGPLDTPEHIVTRRPSIVVAGRVVYDARTAERSQRAGPSGPSRWSPPQRWQSSPRACLMFAATHALTRLRNCNIHGPLFAIVISHSLSSSPQPDEFLQGLHPHPDGVGNSEVVWSLVELGDRRLPG